MKPRKRVHILILTFLLIGLSGCGFQLRGTNLEGIQDTKLFIQSSNADLLAAEVRQQLLDAGVEPVSSAAEADHIVTLSNESFERKVVSVSSSTGKVEEYEISYTAMLKIAGRDGKTVTNAEPVSASRDFTFQEGAVLAQVEESSVLKKDIVKQAATSVLRQIRAAVQ